MRPIPTAVLAALLSAPVAAQDSTRVFELHEIETAPAVQNLDEFSATLREGYPPALRDSAIGGRVLVEMVIGADGTVRGATVLEATRAEFGAPSIRAVEVLRFTPAAIEGRPVAVRAVQPVNWEVARSTPAEVGDAAMGACRVLGNPGVAEAPRLLNVGEIRLLLAREYPPFLRADGIGGRVAVRFMVDTLGMPHEIEVLASTREEFSAATLRVMEHSRFTPALIDGRPVPIWMWVPITWGSGR